MNDLNEADTPPTEAEMEAALDPNQLSQGQIRILQMIDKKNLDIDDFSAMLERALEEYIARRDAP